MNVKDLILSKRVAGVFVAGVLRILAHKGIIVPAGVQSDLVDAAIEIGAAVWMVATKIIDARKAASSAA